MRTNKILLTLSFLSQFANAQVYDLNLVVDSEILKYIDTIKKDTNTLFELDDKINYKIKTCNINECTNLVNKTKNTIFVFQNNSIIKSNSNHIITYDNISTLYDENRVLRASEISILEFLKENKKTKSIFLRSNFEEKKQEVVENNLPKLNLMDIYKSIYSNNLLIKQNQNEIISSGLDVDLSKNLYRPKIELFSNVIQIDGDRAKYSYGLYSEGLFEVGVKLTQVLYSNEVIQNIKIKKLLDKSNKNKIAYENEELVYKAYLTYLNILKLEKYCDVIKINKEFVEQNLDFTKQRIEIGVQYKSDLYRWESELANINIQLLNTQKQLQNQKYELMNMILVNDDFNLEDYSLKSHIFRLNDKSAVEFLGNKEVQNRLLEDIIKTHNSLKQVNELINVKNEEYDMNKKSRYLPTIAFEAEAKRIEKRYGDGADYPILRDDNDYQMVLNFNLPIYEGGLKANTIEKNEIELINLKLKYSEVKNLIQKNINQNIDSLSKSYENIDYSKISEKYARKNYELVLDRYKNGKENIISVLDAQNSYMVSKLNESISVYDYLIDLTSVYFFSGNISILSDENKKNEFERNLLGVANEN